MKQFQWITKHIPTPKSPPHFVERGLLRTVVSFFLPLSMRWLRGGHIVKKRFIVHTMVNNQENQGDER